MESFSHLFPWQILSRMAGVNLTHRLYKDRTFDVAKLQAEVTRVIANFNPAGHSSSDAYHDGGWSTIGLVTHKGDPFEDRPLGSPYEKTPAIEHAPYIESIIDSFETDKKRVRLMELQPQKSIFWHYDKGETIDSGKTARIHIPIFTNEKVQVQLSHEDVVWKAGEVWYGDFAFPHRLYNAGTASRVHLVIDVAINDFVLSLFSPDFLAAKDRRIRVRRPCQRLAVAYQIARNPSQWSKFLPAAPTPSAARQ
jgi:hypothetical protein